MKIEELEQAQSISILVTLHSDQLEFPTKVEEIVPRRHAIIAAPILKDDKIIAFRGDHVMTHMMVTYENTKPHIFYNVNIMNLKKSDGSFCHEISTISDSREFNRRDTYRCYVGSNAYVQIGVNCTAIDATIKDISVNGFSFVIPKNQSYTDGAVVHTVLNDFIEETNQKYSFNLYGIIVRTQELQNGNMVCGCRLNIPVVGLEKYIMTKERIRLQKSRGRN